MASSAPLGRVYLEQAARAGKPTEFKIQYDYTTRGVWFDLSPREVQRSDPADPQLQQFTREGAHVQFTPEIRALSLQIAGNEVNPLLKAKKFYSWIADHIQYSFATEYSTVRNLSDTAARTLMATVGRRPCFSLPFAGSTASPPAGNLAGRFFPAPNPFMIGPRFT